MVKKLKMKKNIIIVMLLCLCAVKVHCKMPEDVKNDMISWMIPNGKLLFNLKTGTVDYVYENGVSLKKTIAYVDLLSSGLKTSSSLPVHKISQQAISNSWGSGRRLIFTHSDSDGLSLRQIFEVYQGKQHMQVSLEVSKNGQILETRNISPLCTMSSSGGKSIFSWAKPMLVDLPFDNDNWGKLLPQIWPSNEKVLDGVSHELTMIYDAETYKGLVVGSLEHDFWKTGIRYLTGEDEGELDNFIVFGGAARPDNPLLPANFGGNDGTHDVMPHGTMLAKELRSPLIFIESSNDFRVSNINFGKAEVQLNGSLQWKGNAPMYWNSFSVEGVLGHEGVMMPQGVYQTIDFIKGMDQWNKEGRPVISIDSYDQGIYSTEVLKKIGDYARNAGQEIGFYCSPFSLWTWSNNIENALLPGTKVPLREVILRDDKNRPIPFKDGEWGAYPMDPTHPATRMSMINQIEKAHTIGAKFIKIDFLTAGSLEAVKWYDPKVRSGMQAYNYGMKLFKHLADSIMGNDVFISMAISPMFPHQYAHTRFVSTDVHSHLRDSQPGFAHYGSTAASMITASHMGWVQGTLWPYTNMDNLVMRKFQKHPDLNENEVKARLISLITMGSILGDGSDYRDQLSSERAKKYLNNSAVTNFFAAPKAFMPLKLSVGESMDQQLSFYLKDKDLLVSAFNFDEERPFEAVFDRKKIGLESGNYEIIDFFTGTRIGKVDEKEQSFSLHVNVRDALLCKLQKVK
ncbi:MAG: hypothetical protein K0S24_255 [Sphingobacterium sp.]|jgi:hypothetical protein|nr:hypothetical protein [Sphingobacterium sp.]